MVFGFILTTWSFVICMFIRMLGLRCTSVLGRVCPEEYVEIRH